MASGEALRAQLPAYRRHETTDHPTYRRPAEEVRSPVPTVQGVDV